MDEFSDTVDDRIVFSQLLANLTETQKHDLLIECLDTVGPELFMSAGMAEARDAILYTAMRMEPALLAAVAGTLLPSPDDEDEDGEDEEENEEDEAEGAGSGGAAAAVTRGVVTGRRLSGRRRKRGDEDGFAAEQAACEGEEGDAGAEEDEGDALMSRGAAEVSVEEEDRLWQQSAGAAAAAAAAAAANSGGAGAGVAGSARGSYAAGDDSEDDQAGFRI